MSTYLRLNTYQLSLPTIDLNESSEQAFADAFKAAQILHQHLEQIESTIGSIKEFTRDPFNMAILGLFSMNSHYHSYVFLEIHHDWIGSRFLIENLCRLLLHSYLTGSRQIPFF